MLWNRAENGARALAAAERALALRPGYPQAEFARVHALTSMGRNDEALEHSAMLAASGDPFMQLSHAWQLLGDDRQDEAVALFEELRRGGGPAAADAASALASIAVDEKRYDDAATCSRMRRAIRSRPMACAGSRAGLQRRAATRSRRRASTRASSPARALARATAGAPAAARAGRAEMAEMLIDDYLAAVPADTVDVASGVAAILVEDRQGE